MKIAISNIAWHRQEDETIAKVMQAFGIKGVEIAPTKIWQSPLLASDAEIASYRNFWENKDIEIVSMQALLFGKPNLRIFQDLEKRKETFEYLAEIIALGGKLGAKNLVFGSPKNRLVEDKSLHEVEEISVSFFNDIGDVALENGVVFCIEPNPIDYGCDFVTTSRQGLELVNKVKNQGFGLHLDAAGMTLSKEDIESSIKMASECLCYFHISEPYLAQIASTGSVDHQLFSKTLIKINYQGWTSIEMKAQNPDSNILRVTKALETTLEYYG